MSMTLVMVERNSKDKPFFQLFSGIMNEFELNSRPEVIITYNNLHFFKLQTVLTKCLSFQIGTFEASIMKFWKPYEAMGPK